MAKLISRNELFKEEVQKVNEYISNNKGVFNFDAYVNSCLDELIKIDKEFYTSLKTRLIKEYDNSQFHLEHDRLTSSSNYEIMTSIEEVLTFLKDIETKDISLYDDNQKEIVFDEKAFYSKELEDLYIKLIEVNNKYVNQFKASEIVLTNYGGKDNKTLAQNILDPGQLKEIAKKVAGNKPEIKKEVEKEQMYAMHELTQNKKLFKLKTRSFTIAFLVFAFIGILGIVVLVFF